MKADDLRRLVEEIHMKDGMRQEVIENVGKRTKSARTGEKTAMREDRTAVEADHGNGDRIYRPGGKTSGWHKAAAAAVLLLTVSGIVVFPVRAFVNSLVQERMEEMPGEEVDQILETVYNSQAEADSFSRDYTDSEKSRYESLAQKYQSGAFPKKEIAQADREEDAGEEELCFITSSSTFRLPNRELTDEEILEIIDFNVKRDYALLQNMESVYADEIAEKEEQQKGLIADNIEKGGITQEEAIEIAREVLSVFIGSSGEGMELNSYYSESGRGEAGEPLYNVNWTNIVTHQIYYVDIRAEDGEVMWVYQTNPGGSQEPAIEEAKGKIEGLKKQAQEFMEEKAEVSYEKMFVYYLEYMDGTVYRSVRFLFETKSHAAYGVTYQWDGAFEAYEEVDLSDYQDGGTRTLHRKGEEVKLKEVFRELDI